MALVLPVLMLLVFGIVNYGFIFAAQISLNSSARDAARAGVVKPLASSPATAQTCSEIATNARAWAKTIGLEPTQILVDVAGPAGTCSLAIGATITTGGAAGEKICNQLTTPPVTQLKVLLTYTAVAPVPYVPPSEATLKATGVFQCEYINSE